jgi:hypothetical protein
MVLSDTTPLSVVAGWSYPEKWPSNVFVRNANRAVIERTPLFGRAPGGKPVGAKT